MTLDLKASLKATGFAKSVFGQSPSDLEPKLPWSQRNRRPPLKRVLEDKYLFATTKIICDILIKTT
jgi:hypothetical protein